MQHAYWVIDGVLAGRAGPAKFPWDLAAIARAGIGGIISLDGMIHREDLAPHDITHLPVQQPMIVLDSEPLRERFLSVMPLVVEFVDRFRKREQAVLVHCFHGYDRTGAVLASYLVAREGLSAEDAIRRIRDIVPPAMSVDGYAEAVELFERISRPKAQPSASVGSGATDMANTRL